MSRVRGFVIGAACSVAFACGLAACGPGAPPPAPQRASAKTPAWQDVFDATPDAYLVLRPRAFARDAVYGPAFKSLMRVAQARTAMRGATALEALEGSEEIIVARWGGARGARGGLDPREESEDDAVVVLRGVPANLDAQQMKDASGAPLFRLVEGRTTVPEYVVSAPGGEESSTLFVLADRTWVGAVGGARGRARQAFATPFGRPVPRAEAGVLAFVRFEASAFVTARAERSGLLGPLVKRLRNVTLALAPGKGGLVARLRYADEDAAAWSELHAKGLVTTLGEAAQRRADAGAPSPGDGASRELPAWADALKDARIERDEGTVVVVTVALPARLLEALPRATVRDLDL